MHRSCIHAAAACSLVVTAACSYLPQPPTTLAHRRPAVATTVGRVVGPTTVVATVPGEGRVAVRKFWDAGAPPGFPALLDPRVALLWVFRPQWQTNVHASWQTAGAELRWLPLGGEAPLPFALTAGFQSDFFFGRGGHRVGRLGAVIQPSVTRWLQLNLGVGSSYGVQRMEVGLDGTALNGEYGVDQQVPNVIRALRRDWRADGLLGVTLRGQSFAVTLAAQPYFALDTRQPSLKCVGCKDGTQLESYDNSWGAAITATVGN